MKVKNGIKLQKNELNLSQRKNILISFTLVDAWKIVCRMALWMVRTGLQPGQHYYHHQLPVDTITKQPLHQYSPYINLLKQFQQHTVCHSLPTNFYLCSSARYFYCTLVRAFTILVGPGIESLAKFKS